MRCLDVGVGARTYRFRPRVTYECTEPIFVDVELPDEYLRKRFVFVVASVEYLPFRDNVFDYAVASHVIEHVNDPSKALSELARVVRKGSRVMIRVPNFLNVNAYRDPTHRHVFSVFKLVELGRRLGLRVVFPLRAGSLLPKPIRKVLTILMNILCEELVIFYEKR